MRIAVDRQLTHTPQPGQASIWPRLFESLRCLRPAWDFVDYNGAPTGEWRRWLSPFVMWRKRADAIHCTPAVAPPWRATADLVIAIDDLTVIESPRGHTIGELSISSQQVGDACRRASRIICPTFHLRELLVQEFGADMAQISVIPPGPPPFTQPSPREVWGPTLQRYGITGPFVLHYGEDQPHRNTRRMIEAWAMADRSVRQKLDLVIVGLSESTGNDLAQVVNRLGLGRNVKLLRWFADDGDLQTLLSAADITAMPVLATGFPQFALEAWAGNATLITSNIGGLPEIIGDAGVFVEPHDPCAIARALKRIVQDVRLRRELVQRGQARLQRYSWERSAELLTQVFESLRGAEATPDTSRRAA